MARPAPTEPPKRQRSSPSAAAASCTSSMYPISTARRTPIAVPWLPDNVAGQTAPTADEILAHAKEIVPPNLAVEFHEKSGAPTREIVRMAKKIGADLIVVGGRGLGALEGFFLGSVSQGVIEDAECAVMVGKITRGGREHGI